MNTKSIISLKYFIIFVFRFVERNNAQWNYFITIYQMDRCSNIITNSYTSSNKHKLMFPISNIWGETNYILLHLIPTKFDKKYIQQYKKETIKISFLPRTKYVTWSLYIISFHIFQIIRVLNNYFPLYIFTGKRQLLWADNME